MKLENPRRHLYLHFLLFLRNKIHKIYKIHKSKKIHKMYKINGIQKIYIIRKIQKIYKIQALNRSMPNQSQLVCFNDDQLSTSTGKKVLNYQCQTNWQDLVSCQYQSGAPSYKYQSGAPSYQCQINVQNPEPVRFKQ